MRRPGSFPVFRREEILRRIGLDCEPIEGDSCDYPVRVLRAQGTQSNFAYTAKYDSGIQWFVLQKDATPEELAYWTRSFLCATLPPQYLEGFVNTASVIQALDLGLSIDTVTAHVAGACGRPLWLLLPAFMTGTGTRIERILHGTRRRGSSGRNGRGVGRRD